MLQVRSSVVGALAAGAALVISASPAGASDCANTSTGLVPLTSLGGGLYLGQYQGGLYANGSNFMPTGHASAGLFRGLSVIPRNTAGAPDPKGSYVLLSIGMSNTTMEFCSGSPQGCAPFSFIGKAANDPQVDHANLVILDGASGGQTAGTWDDPADPNYDRVRDQVLAPEGLAEPQVAALWIKVANANPTISLPNPGADAFTLLSQLGNIARAVHVRYPNVRQAFLSSRIYAGYASTPLNPEPYAYESAFAVKWLVQAQITQMQTGRIDPLAGNLDPEGPDAVAPWLGWGPYIWADGLAPAPGGLTWTCADFNADGTHPATSGREKVAERLLDFMLHSPWTKQWFLADPPVVGDLNGDGLVNGADLGLMLGAAGPCPGPIPGVGTCAADLNGDGAVNGADVGLLLGNWT
ncbi:MAG: dockerin type I repeat-containing protein [Phycisphaerales bacterium]